ncbi:MAG: S53 family peptidase [Steroidobacteraceae bacterium]
MRLHKCLLTAACAVGILGTAAATPNQQTADTQDAGPTTSSSLVTTSIILNVKDMQGLEQFIADTTTPGSPDYHHFLTVSQFAKRFAPSNQAIGRFVHYLQSFGITVNEVYPDNLDISATGTAGEFNVAFSTQLHDYMRNGQRFHRPAWKFVLPSEFSTLVLAAPGLTNEPGNFRPKNVRLGQGAFASGSPPAITWPMSGSASGTPGEYTVHDVANFYDVNPLYTEGVQGHGQTVGIMTLANFRTADAYAYWKDIGLSVPQNRITKVMEDGGTPIAVGVGDDETSLDVEQSGGLAPDAKIRVYIAPNTNNGFLDLFYGAVADNQAGSVSISWGEPEEFYFAALNGGVDYTGQLVAIDQALMEGAAQGQSFFAASGDAGAYDVNDSQIAPYPYYSKQLTVDAPANDPYITAAGGTTVAATEPGIPSAGCPAITIPQEQVWGWDYLVRDWANCLANLGLTPNDLFPGGGGGGVSSFWSIPSYQQSVRGMRLTRPGQSLYYFPNYPSKHGAQDLIDLPGYFAGRNLPDLALNADPQTGYIVVDCTDFPASQYPGCAAAGYGGTSFVGPQLNGMTALIDDAAGGRVGFLNPVIYSLKYKSAYGSSLPFNDIVKGDNWFYDGHMGYDNGSGIGTVNVANLALFFVVSAEGAQK